MAFDASTLQVRVREDRLAVLVDCVVARKTLPLLSRAIASQLKEKGVTSLPSTNEITMRLVQAAKENRNVKDLVIMEGVAPIPPRDGTIEWADDFFTPGYYVDEKTGTMDYRRPKGRPEVSKGQLLARLIPPRRGRAGLDVFGNEIPVSEPESIMPRAGANVSTRHIHEGTQFFSEVDGRVKWDGDTLSVDEMLVVEGDVGLETGNIDHPKRVVIHGDVLDDSRVRAGDTIEIDGLVRGAEVITEGDLIIGGGILGASDGAAIRSKGLVQAKYVIDVTVEAGGDVIVANEITNAVVNTTGAVRVPEGRVVGGRIIALGGIEVGESGSPGLQRTHLVAAEDYTILDKLTPLRKRVASLEKAYGMLHKKLMRYYAQRRQLSEKTKEKALRLAGRTDKLKEALKRLRAEVEELERPSRERAKPVIEIRTKLHSDTVLQIGQQTLPIHETLDGPLRAYLMDGEICLSGRYGPVKLRPDYTEPQPAEGKNAAQNGAESEASQGPAAVVSDT